jgi:hypothetical protein
MLRFIKLESPTGTRTDHIDLASVVYVRETNTAAYKDDQGLEVQVHLAGGAMAQLGGEVAREFLRQFTAYAQRLNLHSGTPTPSGPGLSALSP